MNLGRIAAFLLGGPPWFQINQEPSPCGHSPGPAHPCAQGPIQEGWGLQHGHASRRRSWMFTEQALGFRSPQMLSTLRSHLPLELYS